MAKKPTISKEEQVKSDAMAFGLSSESFKKTTASVEERLKKIYNSGHTQFIMAINGEEVHFELVTIPNDEILSKTVVISENKRLQQYVSRYSVIELTNEIKENGQAYPAIAQLGEDGLIEIVDGSQRRQACYFSGVDFKIFMTKNKLSNNVASKLSDSTNTHKPLSLLERGKTWSEMLSNGTYKNQKELSIGEAVNPSIVNHALKATEIPDSILTLFPSPTDLGKSSVKRIHSLISPLSSDDLAAVEQEFKEYLNETALTQDFLIRTENDVKKYNALVLESLVQFLSLDVQKKQPVKHKELSDGSKGRATFNDKNLKIDIKNVSDEFANELETLINKYGLTFD